MTLLGLMMFSNNVGHFGRRSPLANFKEGERDPYIHSGVGGGGRGPSGKLILSALFMTNLNGVIFV